MNILDKIRTRRLLKDIKDERLEDLEDRLKRLDIRIQKEDADKIKDHADAVAEGMNDFDVRRIDATNDREKAELVAERAYVAELIEIRKSENPTSS